MPKGNGLYLEYKCLISHDCWRAFQEKYPNFKQLGFDYWTVRRILSSFGDLVIEEVFKNPRGFELPYKFGHLIMIGNKVTKRTESLKKRKIDYVRTDNVIYGLRWFFKKAKVKRINYYKGRTAKLVLNKINKAIKEDKFFNWIVVDDIKKVMYYEI